MTELEKELTKLSKSRYEHVMRVCVMAKKIWKISNSKIKIKSVEFAAMYHDITKEKNDLFHIDILKDSKYKNILKENKKVWHGYSAAEYLKRKYNIVDEDILNAIRYHTTGEENIGELELIIFLADYLEPGRGDITNIKIDDIQKHGLEKISLCVLDETIEYLNANKIKIGDQTYRFKKYLESISQ